MSGSKKILITGANGLLGQKVTEMFANETEHLLVLTDLAEKGEDTHEFEYFPMDITKKESVKESVRRHLPDIIINTAAYTNVDGCETERELSWKVNVDSVKNFIIASRVNNSKIIHISTDYVFDGFATVPYIENNPINPLSVYGASKLKGEELAIENNPASIIIRTSWVYSSFGNNVVKTMLRLMKERDSINVVEDQIGRPTYAAELANAIMTIISKGFKITKQLRQQGDNPSTIYNYSNSGEPISWYQFALAIKELSGVNCIVNPIPTSQYPTPAKRPQYSVLDIAKIKQHFPVRTSEWKESLHKCLLLL